MRASFLIGGLLVLAGPLFGCAMGPMEKSQAGFESPATGNLASMTPAAAMPAPVALPAAGKPIEQPPRDARQVIYSAAYKVVVGDTAGTLRTIQSAAERLGGYMQEVSGSTITLRVPATRFTETIKVIEEAGEVVDRQIRALDVTEEMRDLHIRLENAEKLRQRLLELFAKADKLEDSIKIEAELARVSEQLDTVKGKIRFVESQLAMSTLRVELNSPVVQNGRGNGPRLPFSWVEQLGDGLVAGQVQQATRRAGFFSRGPSFAPPPGFVRYYEEESQIDAMDATGLLLRVQRWPNVDKAPLEFWAKLSRRSLVEGRSLAVTREEGDAKVYVLHGTREVSGKPVNYLLAVKRSDRWVTVFEAWGAKDAFDHVAAPIRASSVTVNAD